MRRSNIVLTICVCLLAVSGLALAGNPASPATFQVSQRWEIGGAGGWDYLVADPASQRLFVTRGDRVVVVDLASGKAVGEIKPTDGVHGVALAAGRGKGYASDGRANAVTVFDLRSLEITGTIRIDGKNPDAIVYDVASSRVFTFNGHSHDATVIDADSEKTVATIALSGKPEFAVSDGKGRVFVNIEDRGELVVIDVHAAKVAATWSLGDCEEPTGLAFDENNQRLFSVCQNGHLVVTNAQDGATVTTVPIGRGPDAVAFDPGTGRVYSSNGEDGTLTIIHQESADRYVVMADVPTQRSARTLALDPTSHRVYLSAAEFEAPVEQGGRPAVSPDTFSVLVVNAP